MKILFILLMLSFAFSFCTKSNIERVLEQAGDNRKELEKVLDYYEKDPKDSLKLLAAQFLIENMDIHHSFQSEELKQYYLRLDSIFKLNLPDAPITKEQDSLLSILVQPNMHSLSIIPDLKTISADFLIKNIEQAFEAWKSPFAKNLSFNDFCEYLLPYRVGYEQAIDWRSLYESTFQTQLRQSYDTICRLDNGVLIQNQWVLHPTPIDKKYKQLPENLFSGILEFTVSGWIKPENNKTFTRLFDFGKGESCYICFIPYDNQGKASLRFQAQMYQEQQIVTDGLPANQWSHVAVSFTQGNICLYINGVLIESKDFGIDLNRFVCNYIGKSQYVNDPYFEGEINNFQVYNRVLTNKEIKTLALNKYHLLDSQDGLLIQKDFKNLSSNIEYRILKKDLFSDISEFTISGWIKPDKNNVSARFFDFGRDDTYYIGFIPFDYFHKASLIFKTQEHQEQYITGYELPANQWSHIVVSFSQKTINLYINSKLIGSRYINIDIKKLVNNYIGKSQYDHDPYFEGRIRDFRFYNRELNYSEVLKLSGKEPLNREENLQYILERLRTHHYRQLFNKSFVPGGYDPSLLLNLKKGSCNDYSILGTHIFRSIGIPSAIDFSLQAGHDWNVLIVDKKNYDCSFIDNDTIGKHVKNYEKIIPDRISKIFRHTYAKQKNTPAMSGSKETFPESFRNPCIKDVSDLYLPTSDISVNLERKPPKGQNFSYLCFFLKEWIPVHWSKQKGNRAIFTKMGKGVVYLPVYYHNNQIYPATYPFALNMDGSIQTLRPNMVKTQKVKLTRKFPEKAVHQKYILQDAKFQVAQKADFSDALTIYTIDKRPEIRYNEVDVIVEHKYRYFRFVAPPKSNGGEICEIDVFDGNHKKIEFNKIIGNYDSPPDRTPKSVFDGNPLSSYWCHQQDDGWVGLDFGKPVDIMSFRFLPLNDDNFIRENELYELFYWDDKWISLGQQTGTSKQYLEYEKAPTNALFWLKNLTKGKEERIFTYENNMQIWW